MTLPVFCEWHISRNIFGPEAPFTSFLVNFSQLSGRVENGGQTYPLATIAVLGADKFGASFQVGTTRGRFEAEHENEGKLNVTFFGGMARGSYTARPVPGTIRYADPFAVMTPEAKVREAITRSLPLLPAETRSQLTAMLTPEAFVFMSAAMVAWAVSHAFAVGEIVDVILLTIGFVTIGVGVVTGAQALYDFVTTAIEAKNSADLDRAAQHFATAVNILGISVISALFLRGSAKGAYQRTIAPRRSMVPVAPHPPVPRAVRWNWPLPPGVMGRCDSYGNIYIARGLTKSEQLLVYFHEWAHSVLVPRLGPLRELRTSASRTLYRDSALMRYLEEALVESFARLRIDGLRSGITGIAFPVTRPGGPQMYVTVAQLATEGIHIGNIVIGAMRFHVNVIGRPLIFVDDPDPSPR